MTIELLADTVVDINNDRVDGKITREQHAIMIQQVDALLTKNGWSWDALAAAAK